MWKIKQKNKTQKKPKGSCKLLFHDYDCQKMFYVSLIKGCSATSDTYPKWTHNWDLKNNVELT